jgi:hypothetical protein
VTGGKAWQMASQTVLVGSEYRYNFIHVVILNILLQTPLSQGCQIRVVYRYAMHESGCIVSLKKTGIITDVVSGYSGNN